MPALLGINLLPLLWAAFTVLRRPKENKTGVLLLAAAAAHVALYSVIPHKEFRFVLPLVPLFLYLIQDVIVPWSRKAKKWQLYLLTGLILVGNAVPAAYFGLIHQSGTLKVMPLLRDAIEGNNKSSVLFLMPCHSTPLYSHLHANITTRYLDCSPPPPGTNTEAEAFYNNPAGWWRQHIRQNPSLVVMFDVLKGRLADVMSGYKLLHEIPHTQFPEGEVSEKVLVFQKAASRPPADAAL
ncbi:alg9-like mannosyltransferase family domain-containing protein [Phthorimaea operculella]|nr:alg9-like mannosyltransferase family domain-containing protein [Phthorimaea operculella]